MVANNPDPKMPLLILYSTLRGLYFHCPRYDGCPVMESGILKHFPNAQIRLTETYESGGEILPLISHYDKHDQPTLQHYLPLNAANQYLVHSFAFDPCILTQSSSG
jgi:hypothetical protein